MVFRILSTITRRVVRAVAGLIVITHIALAIGAIPVSATTATPANNTIPTITPNPLHTATRTPTVTPTRELSPAEIEANENNLYAENLLKALNAMREKYDRPALVVDPALQAVAEMQALHFAQINKLTERGPDNVPLKTLAKENDYAGGAAFSVRQSSAMVWRSTPVTYILDHIWFATVSERAKILSSDYLHVGVSTTVVNNRRFVALITGKLANGALVYTPIPTIDGSTPVPFESLIESDFDPAENPVITATMASDGSVAHDVKKGQTLSDIAVAYEIGWNALALLNNLDLESPVIYEGDTILIRPRFTATLTPTITKTPIPSTRTPRPTFTASVTNPSNSTSFAPQRTKPGGYIRKLYRDFPDYERLIGWVLVGVSLFGLALSLLLRKK